jgi:Holliday junction resolvasome RuvABC DNA-binding subunit
MPLPLKEMIYLTRVPGIGSKTAKKIVLELKDKFRTLASAPLDFADGQSEVNADVVGCIDRTGF